MKRFVKRFVTWIIKTFYPDLIQSSRPPHWVDEMAAGPQFERIRALIDEVDKTGSWGQHKQVYVLTAMTSEARRNGTPTSVKDINFLIELALQMKKRGL